MAPTPKPLFASVQGARPVWYICAKVSVLCRFIPGSWLQSGLKRVAGESAVALLVETVEGSHGVNLRCPSSPAEVPCLRCLDRRKPCGRALFPVIGSRPDAADAPASRW